MKLCTSNIRHENDHSRHYNNIRIKCKIDVVLRSLNGAIGFTNESKLLMLVLGRETTNLLINIYSCNMEWEIKGWLLCKLHTATRYPLLGITLVGNDMIIKFDAK